ncbi:MAG: hypothetical protein RLZZ152_371, partial [Pseudomonadota bacterium]
MAKPLPPIKNGYRELPTDPGLGITIDEDKLRGEVDFGNKHDRALTPRTRLG